MIVTGCMAKIQLEKIKKSNPKTIILPYESIKMITKILLFIKKNYCNNLFSNEKLMLLNEEIKKTKKTFNYLDSYLNIKKIRLNKNIHISQISEGCIFECSYCIVKKAKGELKSFNPKDIFRDIKLAIDEGCTEIWLTSQDNSQYGIDFKKNTKYYGFRLPDLLKLIIKIQGNFKIRIGMMNPTTVSTILNGLLDVFKSEKIYKVLHLPIQSASDNVLLNMNRKHKIIVANEIINMFRFSFPNITIITDIIVGFCYETEIDFQKTINWI